MIAIIITNTITTASPALEDCAAASEFTGTGLMGTWLNGYLVLQGKHAFKNFTI